jgi:hypothetical protein
MQEEFRARREAAEGAETAAVTDTSGRSFRRGRRGAGDGTRGADAPDREAAGGSAPGDRALLWTVDDGGRTGAVPVRTGITDGQYTEVSGPRVAEGQEVILAITSASADETTVNPFQQGRDTRRPGPPGL